MRKFKLMMFGLASVCVLQACVKDPEAEANKKYKENLQQIRQYFTDNGIAPWDGTTGWQEAVEGSDRFYYVIQPASANATLGRKPEKGDQLVVHYIGQLLNGIEFEKSAADKPLRFAYNDGQIIPGFNMGIGKLHEGQKADLYLPSNLAYGNRDIQAIPPYSALKFSVNLEKVMTQDEALKDYIERKQLKNVDNTPIAAIPLNVESKSYNLYRIVTKAGTGATPEATSRVTLNYRGLLLSGAEFDKGTITPSNSLDKLNLITGFTEAVKRMKEGEKATVLMPSGLAYGDTGSGRSIAPYAPLVFELELLKVE
jgi:FKBP-type peptidyl-prolyl cis-trans isomerase